MSFRPVPAALAAALLLSGAVRAETLKFTAPLTGAAEVPANSETGSGMVKAMLDTGSKLFSYTATYEGLTGPAGGRPLPRPGRTGRERGARGGGGERGHADHRNRDVDRRADRRSQGGQVVLQRPHRRPPRRRASRSAQAGVLTGYTTPRVFSLARGWTSFWLITTVWPLNRSITLRT